MQVKSLQTRNFKKLGTQSFEFTSGVNFISGENGAGKSTLLRGIAAALFGVQMMPGHSDHIATFGQKTWELKLVFTHNGHQYVLERKRTTASLLKGEELVANGNTPVTKYVEDLLGMAAKDFNLLVHSRQGETNYVLTYGATALQRKIEEFSGVEVVEKVASLASGLGRDLDVQVEAQQSTLLNEEEKEAKEELRLQAEQAVTRLKEELEKLGEVEIPEKPEISISQASRKRSGYLNYLRDLEQYREAKQQVREDLDSLEPVEEPQEPEQLKQNLKAAQEELKELKRHNQDVQRVRAKKESLGNQLRDIEEPELELDLIKVQLNNAAKSIQDAQQKIADAKTEISHLQSHLKDATCKVCGSELKEVDEDAINEKIKGLEGDINYNSLAICDFEEDQRRLQRMAGVWVEIQQQKELKEQFDSIPDAEELSEDNIQEIISELRNGVTQFEDKRDTYQAHLSRHKRLSDRLASLKEPEQVEEVEQSFVEGVERKWEEYQAQVTLLETLNLKKENLQKDIQYNKRTAETVSEELHKDSEKQKEVRQLVDESEVAKNLNKYLRDRRGEYLAQVWDGITYRAGEFLRSATKGWLEDVRIDDGKFLYKEEGAWIPTVELSGAQESFVGTALRVGISKALYQSSMFLIFDEPTDGMKEENARNLIAELAGTADQVFIVSHKETDQALADNIVEIV